MLRSYFPLFSEYFFEVSVKYKRFFFFCAITAANPYSVFQGEKIGHGAFVRRHYHYGEIVRFEIRDFTILFLPDEHCRSRNTFSLDKRINSAFQGSYPSRHMLRYRNHRAVFGESKCRTPLWVTRSVSAVWYFYFVRLR